MSTKQEEKIVSYQRIVLTYMHMFVLPCSKLLIILKGESPLKLSLGSLHGLFQQDKGAYGLRISLELLCNRETDTPIRRKE